jgi:hypothetical protein
MNNFKKLKNLIILLLLTNGSIYGQISKKGVDTISIFKNKSGIRYKVYEEIWFPSKREFGYFNYRINEQDRNVFEVDTLKRKYFKVFNSKGRLLLEGLQEENTTSLSGDVKYYRRNGGILRVDQWKTYHSIDTANYTISIGDGPIKVASMKYNKNGSLKKSVERIIKINSINPLSYCLIIKTIKYRNKSVKSIKKKEIKCYEK